LFDYKETVKTAWMRLWYLFVANERLFTCKRQKFDWRDFLFFNRWTKTHKKITFVEKIGKI